MRCSNSQHCTQDKNADICTSRQGPASVGMQPYPPQQGYGQQPYGNSHTVSSHTDSSLMGSHMGNSHTVSSHTDSSLMGSHMDNSHMGSRHIPTSMACQPHKGTSPRRAILSLGSLFQTLMLLPGPLYSVSTPHQGEGVADPVCGSIFCT